LIFWAFVNFLALQPLAHDSIQAAVDLDHCCLGGLWTASGYQREIDSPNSDLLALSLNSSALNSSKQEPPRLIGLACLWAILDEAHITLLAVDPAYRGQGLGQALLYALLVAAWRRNLEWATLEVRVSNQMAIQLYKKFGFEAVGQRRGYYQDKGEDALILWRKGIQQPMFQTFLKQWQQELGERLQQNHWNFSNFLDIHAEIDWNPSTIIRC
jgi:[ribosomal protein S18]-alanine N-acetyltransferase